MAKTSGRVGSVIKRVRVPAGEIKIPPELLKAFAEESQGFHIKWGPDWIGIVAINAAFMQKLLANSNLVDVMQKNGMKLAIQG